MAFSEYRQNQSWCTSRFMDSRAWYHWIQISPHLPQLMASENLFDNLNFLKRLFQSSRGHIYRALGRHFSIFSLLLTSSEMWRVRKACPTGLRNVLRWYRWDATQLAYGEVLRFAMITTVSSLFERFRGRYKLPWSHKSKVESPNGTMTRAPN